MLIAERCRDLMTAAYIPHEGSSVAKQLTLSIGVATIIPSHSDELLAFIEAADKRMYQAKERGRDTIVSG